MNRENNTVSGVRIRTINAGIILAACLLMTAFLILNAFTSAAYDALEESMDKYVSSELAANELKHASDNLTTQVRMLAVTQEREYLNRYFLELNSRRRENAVRILQQRLSDTEARRDLDEAMQTSSRLEEIEFYAMRLVSDACGFHPDSETENALEQVLLTPEDAALSPEEKLERAEHLTHNELYQKYDEKIDEYVALCIRGLNEERDIVQQDNTRRLHVLLRFQLMLAFLLLAVCIAAIAAVTRLVILPLHANVEQITNFQPLPMTGAYELRYLAQAYNTMYSENQKNSAHLRHEAEHDPLTGLYNRGAFDKLREEYRSQPIAMMILDVDLFKGVNDTYGHGVGDRVLQKVASLLDRNFRFTDYPCRIGGDEFAVIMTDASSSMKDLVRQKLRRISESLRNTSDGLPAVTLSIGVAFNDRKDGTDDIYKDADRALYAVKTHGRDACEFYGESYMKL